MAKGMTGESVSDFSEISHTPFEQFVFFAQPHLTDDVVDSKNGVLERVSVGERLAAMLTLELPTLEVEDDSTIYHRRDIESGKHTGEQGREMGGGALHDEGLVVSGPR
jgi:hypothetical protein